MTTLQAAWLLVVCRSTLVLGLAGTLYLIAGRRRPQECTLWQRCAVAALLALPVAAWSFPAIEIPLLSSAPDASAGVSGSFMFSPNRSEIDEFDSIAPVIPISDVSISVSSHPRGRLSAAARTEASLGPSDQHGASLSWKAVLGWVLVVTWGVIASLLGFRIVRSSDGLEHLRKCGCVVTEPVWQSALEHWRARLGVRRPVELRSSDAISAAMTFGWRSPVILIPREYLTACDADQRHAVLVHELTHVAHGDFLWHLLTELTACLYWPHPLMWLNRRQQGILRERICDAFCAHHLSRQSYGESLVRLAERMISRPAFSLGLMMTHRSSLKRRLIDLAGCEPEQCLPPGRVGRALLVSSAWSILILFIAGSLTARAGGQGTATSKADQAQAAPAKTETTGNEKKEQTVLAPTDADRKLLPTKLDGKVVDPEGKPVAEARIVVRFHGPKLPGSDSAAGRRTEWRVTTGSDGEYSITFDQRIPSAGAAFEVTIVADNFPRLTTWIQGAQVAGGTIEPQRLLAGRVIRGRLAHPKGAQKVEGTIRILANTADLHLLWDSGPISTGKLGTFTVSIPREGHASAAIYPKGFAPRYFDIPADATDVGEIPVEAGTSLTGQVLDKSGKPVAGTVVAIQNTEYHHVHSFINLIGTAVKTDKQGRFTLPPVRGKYRVWVTNGAADRSQQGMVSGIQPPPILPTTLELGGADKPQKLDLREAGSATIRGTVLRSDGSPVPNLEIRANLAPVGREIGYDLGSARTGPDGRYALLLPTPLTKVSVSTEYHMNSEGNYEQAKAVGRGKNRDKLFPSMTIDRLSKDVEDADFLVGGTKPAAQQALNVFDSPADRDLEEIGQRETAAMKAYQEAAQQATPEKQLEIFRTLDPRNVSAADYVAFERKHRGTTAAVCAMHHVMRNAASIGDAESPVSNARIALVEIAIEHYQKHEDLDLLLKSFSGGTAVPRAPTLFEKAAESPHPHVRAEALYYMAEYEGRKFQVAESLALAEQLAAEFPEASIPVETLRSRGAATYGAIDLQASRRKSIELLDRILTDYPEVRAPYRVFEFPLMLRFKIDPAHEATQETIADRARKLRFRVAELQFGKPVPELTGETVDGEEISSIHSRGRVAVLLFSSSQEGHSAEIRRQLAGLRKEYPGELDVIEVFNPLAPGEAAPDNGWPVIAEEGPTGPLRLQWVDHTPGVVIIDAQGNLRSDTMLPFNHLGPCVKAAMKGAAP